MSKYKKIIFLQPTKTGSSSVLVGLKELGIRKNHKPITCGNVSELKNKNVFSFLTVRNPYTRALSMYNFFGMFEGKCFDYFLEYIKENQESMLFAPQHKYYLFGTFKVDAVLRLENFDKDWELILNSKLNLKKKPLHINKDIREKKKKLSKEEKNFIYEIYKKDFDIFNYKK